MKKNTDKDIPMLAYASIKTRSIELPKDVSQNFEKYAEYFNEKSNFDLSGDDVLAGKANELFTSPEKISVESKQPLSSTKITIPNSSWAGIQHAAKYHNSSEEEVIEAISKKIKEDPRFLKWLKRQKKLKKDKLN